MKFVDLIYRLVTNGENPKSQCWLTVQSKSANLFTPSPNNPKAGSDSYCLAFSLMDSTPNEDYFYGRKSVSWFKSQTMHDIKSLI